ncbi:HAMP domain-containing histidine kinase (plasmid) [Bacillus sp. F19]|nr:HAMP domain-containing histidine kinase [Bacillus sp. F19]
MNLRKKLTFHFVLHFILMLVVIISLIIAALVSLSFVITQSEMKADFTRVSKEYLEHAITIEENEATLNKAVKESVTKKGGWLQIIAETGEVIGEYNTPEKLPDSYNFTDILSIDLKDYQTYHWEIKKEADSKLIVLYGEKIKSKQILTELMAMDSFPNINEKTQQYLKQHNAWMQVYSEKGEIINSYAAPEKLKYTFNELLKTEKEPWNSPFDISTYLNKNEEFLYLVGTKNVYYSPDSITDRVINRSFIKSFVLVSISLVILIIGLAIWYGKKFGMPLLHMMRWINNMSEGNLSEPMNKKGQNPLYNKIGILDKKYVVFKDVLKSLEILLLTLRKNEEFQIKTDKTREEWITGLSHDLKTPLSSIYGYSTLLESNTYDWSQDETRDFGHTIKEKAEYMSELIEDLNLTYRLKSHALPINKEKREIVSFLKELIAQYKSQENTIFIDSTSHSIFLEIDPKWFTRIINNLLLNAIKHNPVGTVINIKLNQLDKSTFIFIEDNGNGMDEETVSNLFNRYYRGGSTKEGDDGSGLGMAIAYQLVIAHNGEVEVMSKKNIGTTVKLTFHHINNS